MSAFGFVGMYFLGSGMPYILVWGFGFFFRLNSTKLLLFILKAAFGIPAGAQLGLLPGMEAIASKTSCSLGSQ